MSKLLIHDKPIMILPSLAQKIGLNEAIILQQIHYWLVSSQHEKREENGSITRIKSGNYRCLFGQRVPLSAPSSRWRSRFLHAFGELQSIKNG